MCAKGSVGMGPHLPEEVTYVKVITLDYPGSKDGIVDKGSTAADVGKHMVRVYGDRDGKRRVLEGHEELQEGDRISVGGFTISGWHGVVCR